MFFKSKKLFFNDYTTSNSKQKTKQYKQIENDISKLIGFREKITQEDSTATESNGNFAQLRLFKFI